MQKMIVPTQENSPESMKACPLAERQASAAGGARGSTEGVYVPLQLTLVIGRIVLVDDSFGSQTVQIGLHLAKKLLGLLLIFSLAKLCYHRADPAPVNAVARTTLDVLPRSLGG